MKTFVGIAQRSELCSFCRETEAAYVRLATLRGTKRSAVCFWAAVDEMVASAVCQALDEDDREHALYLLEAHAPFLGRLSPQPVPAAHVA